MALCVDTQKCYLVRKSAPSHGRLVRRCFVILLVAMTPSEMNIFKSLIAVAWADGNLDAPEQGMIDGLLWAFEASDDEEQELREFAKQKRTLADDVPLGDLSPDDRTILLAHAALLTHADGAQTQPEKKVLASLVKLLGYTNAEAKPIIAEARQRAKKLAERL